MGNEPERQRDSPIGFVFLAKGGAWLGEAAKARNTNPLKLLEADAEVGHYENSPAGTEAGRYRPLVRIMAAASTPPWAAHATWRNRGWRKWKTSMSPNWSRLLRP